MDKWDVVVFGDLCVDLIFSGNDTIPEFGQKEKMLAEYSLVMGGSNSIFACQCAKLGLHTAVVGRLGHDAFAPVITGGLASSGVDISYVLTDPGIQTSLTCILKYGEDRAILTVPGSISAVQVGDAPESLLMNARHIHIGSYYLMRQLKLFYPEILQKMKARGSTASLDTNWDPDEKWDGLEDLAGLIDIFLPNEGEVKAITGESDVRKGILALSKWFSIIAVKLGKQGALLFSHGIFYESDALSLPVVDTVGAGDSFDGGFVSAWLSGKPLQESLRLGCFCGSMSVTKAGGTAGQYRIV